jgi:para-nitrobenzyl esterase
MTNKMKKSIFFLMFLFVFVLINRCTTQNSTKISVDSVKTESGYISGIRGNDTEVLVFKGIPYAAPPVGELRWKEPRQVKKWDGARKCDTFGPNAMQITPVPRDVYTSEFFTPVDEPMSEDCLYLNIWTAAKSNQEKRPVIVYIHGGGFVENSGSCIVFDGESMAKKGVIFITFNYRLGVFGFFAHPDLTKESPHNASGNYGILDQIAALRWVKSNIAAFGGDPDNVTIAGESAGALSVNALSASPLAMGLFNKIIAESGACVLNGFGGTENLKNSEARSLSLMKEAGSGSLQELKDMPANELQKLLTRGIGLIVDGYVLTEPIPDTYVKGKQADVPLLTGWNADEIVSDAPITLEQYRNEIIKRFGVEAETVLKLYPASTDEEATIAQKKLSAELKFGIQNYAWARIQSKIGKSKVYLYYFRRKVPAIGEMQKYGAFHAGEITYAYDNLPKLNRPWEPVDYELAKIMSSYWVNFAVSGNPNGEGLIQWPSFDVGQGKVMIFDKQSEVVKHPFYDALELFYRKLTDPSIPDIW